MRAHIRIEAGDPIARAQIAAMLRVTADLLETASSDSPAERGGHAALLLLEEAPALDEGSAAQARLQSLAASRGISVAQLVDEARTWIAQHSNALGEPSC
ncbi:hypothetical protein [Imhoffiella purpurea]|uniref:Uncharacterized protein n=1 Tax=Imhoffiella purpurea TaxID=1249627 RepID=W9VT82_9GAMM|nr:hypothetical protein [Imhoffiella purpurea]EXJ13595.1 hypothetical protein D779_3598 [Imhoffiella purpurea]